MARMAQIEIITGVERRRRWSAEQKRAILAAAFAPGAVVTDVARRADINTGLIYRWRQELSAGAGGFAEVIVSPPAAVDCDSAPPSAIEVALGDGAQVRIPASASPELAAAVLKALAGR